MRQSHWSSSAVVCPTLKKSYDQRRPKTKTSMVYIRHAIIDLKITQVLQDLQFDGVSAQRRRCTRASCFHFTLFGFHNRRLDPRRHKSPSMAAGAAEERQALFHQPGLTLSDSSLLDLRPPLYSTFSPTGGGSPLTG